MKTSSLILLEVKHLIAIALTSNAEHHDIEEIVLRDRLTSEAEVNSPGLSAKHLRLFFRDIVTITRFCFREVLGFTSVDCYDLK